MTDYEHEILERNFKQFKRKHPFHHKKYREYTLYVIQLLDELEKLDDILTIDEDTLEVDVSEKTAISLTEHIGNVIGLVKLWQKNPMFHPFQSEIVTSTCQTFVDCIYRTIQDTLNVTMADMNHMLIEYLQKCKNDIVAEDIKDNGGYVDEQMDDFIMMHDNIRSEQLEFIVKTRNEFTANRLISRLQLMMFRNIIAYDYIEIMAGVDIIRERKRTSKEVGNVIKRNIKFIDIRTLKGENRNELIKPRT